MGTANQFQRNNKAAPRSRPAPLKLKPQEKSVLGQDSTTNPSHPSSSSSSSIMMSTSNKKRRISAVCAAALSVGARPEDVLAASGGGVAGYGNKISKNSKTNTIDNLHASDQYKIWMAVDFNNKGVAFFEKADYETSWKLFRRALHYLRGGEGTAQLLDATFFELTNNKTNVLSSTISQNDAPTLSSASPSSSSASAAPSASSYIYQRMDFDEGMNVCTDAYTVGLESDRVTLESTILFNAGQASRRVDQTQRALSLYRQALFVLLPSWTIETAAAAQNTSFQDIAIPVLHNLAQLAYYQKQGAGGPTLVHGANGESSANQSKGSNGSNSYHLRLAMAYYKTALRHCRLFASVANHHSSGGGDLYIAMTLNCIGVLHYHRCSTNCTSTQTTNGKAQNSVQEEKDDSAEAMSAFRQALAIFTDHTNRNRLNKIASNSLSVAIATTLNNLGRVMVQREDYPTALQHYQRALDIRRALLGPRHIDTAATAFNAGQSLHHLRQFAAALQLYKEFLRVAQSVLHPNHRDIAIVLSAMAQIHQERKEYNQAFSLYSKSLKIGRAALGKNHSEVAMLLNRLGNFYFEQEDYAQALNAYKEGLAIERKVLDKTHPNIIVTLSNIGEIYRQQGKFNLAIRLYTKAVSLQKIRHGAVSTEVAGALNVIGLIHDQKGDAHLAVKALQEALVMRRTVLGDDHLDVSATLTYLGTILYRRNMVSTALQLFTESLRIRQRRLGRDHRDVAFTLYNIGLCHQLQGNTVEAVACFQETLRVETIVLGENHKDVTLTLFKLGEAFKADGNMNEALEVFERALRIEKRLLQKSMASSVNGVNDSNAADPASMARTLNEIGNVHLAQGKVGEMMKAFTESARLFRRAGLSIHSVHVSPALKLYAAGFCASAASA